MTKSWSVSYSCRVKGCRWVTSKKKALLCISPNLLSVVLPSDATCSTTRLLESIKLSREGCKPVMQVVKASMYCKVSDAREFLLRFNSPTEANECHRLMTDLGAFEWRSHGRGAQSSQGSVLDIPTDTQLPSSQMDVDEEEMTQCSQVESSPPEPASAQAEVFALLPRAHSSVPRPAAVLPFAEAPIPLQRLGTAPPNYSPEPIMVDAADSAASSSSSTSSSAPATSSSCALMGQTFGSAPILSSTAATTPATTSAGFAKDATSAPSMAVATDVVEDIEITEGNFEFYLSMCLNDPRFPMIVEQVEKAWVRHMGLGGTAAESLERLMK